MSSEEFNFQAYLLSKLGRGKETLCNEIVKKLSGEITSIEEYYELTFYNLYKNNLEKMEFVKLSYALIDDPEWYSPAEITNFLIEQENSTIRSKLFDIFENWDKWSPLLTEMNDREGFESYFNSEGNEECVKYGNLFIEIMTQMKNIEEMAEKDYKNTFKILSMKRIALERRIPVPDSLANVEASLTYLQSLKQKNSYKNEYEKRINREDFLTPDPIINFFSDQKKILHLNENSLKKYLEDLTDSTYNIVSIVGSTGAGKSLLLRGSLSSDNKYAPNSNFDTVGTTRDIRFYLTSKDEMLGATRRNEIYNTINVKNMHLHHPPTASSCSTPNYQITFVDTEGTHAMCARSSDSSSNSSFSESSSESSANLMSSPLVMAKRSVVAGKKRTLKAVGAVGFGSGVARFEEGSSSSSKHKKIRNVDFEETDLRNECLKNVFPLVYFTSTVIIYAVSNLDILRRAETIKEIKSFTQFIQGKVSDNFLLPALIILVNRFSDDEDDNLKSTKAKYLSYLNTEFIESFHSVDFATLPKLTKNRETSKIELSSKDLEKLVKFYEFLSNTIERVNESRNKGFLQAALSLNSSSYFKLMSLVCSSLPNPVDLKQFWQKQILSIMFKGTGKELPSAKCSNFVGKYEEYLRNSLKQPIQTVYKEIVETSTRLFKYYWILKIIETTEMIKNKNIDIKEEFSIPDRVHLWKSDYEALKIFIDMFAPCEFHQEGKNGKVYYCTQSKKNHDSHHRVLKKRKLSVLGKYYIKKIKDPNYLLFISHTMLPEVDNLLSTVTLYTKQNNEFDFHLFFEEILKIIITDKTIPPPNWKKDEKIMKETLAIQKSIFAKEICWLCQSGLIEYIFSCGLPHSMCANCYHYFNQYIVRDQPMFCPFCSINQSNRTPTESRRIFNFIELNSEDTFSFRGREFLKNLSKNEKCIKIISIIGRVKQSYIHDWQLSIESKEKKYPSAFVQFVYCSSLVSSCCLFSDNDIMIVYYCSPDEISTFYSYSFCEMTSTFTVDVKNHKVYQYHPTWIDERKFDNLKTIMDAVLLNNNFNISNQANINSPNNHLISSIDYLEYQQMEQLQAMTPDAKPTDLDLTNLAIKIHYSRPMWTCLMNDFVLVDKYRFKLFWKIISVEKLDQCVGKLYPNLPDKTLSLLREYQARVIFLSCLQVFLVAIEYMSKHQMINGARILSLKLIEKFWNDNQEKKILLIEEMNKFWKYLLDSGDIDSIKSLDNFSLYQIWLFVHFIEEIKYKEENGKITYCSEGEEMIKKFFSQDFFYDNIASSKINESTKKVQSLCCLCFTSSRNTAYGCGEHSICRKCWIHGFLPLIECSNQINQNTPMVNRVLKILQRSKLFSCFICNRPLINCLNDYLYQNECKSLNLSGYVNAILRDIQDQKITVFNRIPLSSQKGHLRATQNNKIVFSNAKPIIDGKVANCEIYRGKFVGKDGRKFDCAIKKLNINHEEDDEASDNVLREISVATLCTGLPCFIECYGSDYTTSSSSCHIGFRFVPKTLTDLLKDTVVKIDKLRALEISFDIARGLRLLHLLGLTHRDMKPSNILIDEEGIDKEAKLIDFGQTRVLDPYKTMTVGTQNYRAPELLYSSNYSEKIDQYSYGVILVEIFLHVVDPQLRQQFHRSKNLNHWEVFKQFNVAAQLSVIYMDHWDSLELMISKLLSNNAVTRPSFAECLNVLNNLIFVLAQEKRVNVLFEDETVNYYDELASLNSRVNSFLYRWFVFFFFFFLFFSIFFLFNF